MSNGYWIFRWRFFPHCDGNWSNVSFDTLTWYVEDFWSLTKDKPGYDGSYMAGIDIELIDGCKTVRSLSFDNREEALKMIKKWRTFS